MQRSGLEQVTLEASPQAHCLGAAIYVYDHESRDLCTCAGAERCCDLT